MVVTALKIWDLFNDVIDKIPEPVMSVLNFLATLFTIAAGIGIPTGVFTIFSNSIDLNNGGGSIPPRVFIVSLAIMIILVLVRYFCFKLQTIKNYREINENYYRLMHDFRNEINQMEVYYKEIELEMREWNMELFTTLTSKFLVQELDNLCEILQVLSGSHKKVCGCIKYLYTNETGPINYNNALVKTFVRSRNTDSNRVVLDEKNAGKPIKVSENTDFRTIVNGDQSYNNDAFYKQNLIKYDKQLSKADPNAHYDNTTEHYDQYYIATIVAPIRVANKRLFYKSENTDYDLLGFLCVDTLDRYLFTESQRESFTYIVKAYASTFYNMMSKYQYYMMKFAEYEKSLKPGNQMPQKTPQNNQTKQSSQGRRKRNNSRRYRKN